MKVVFVIVVYFILSPWTSSLASNDIYVSPDGKKENPGTLAEPITFSNVQKLVNFANGDHNIYVLGGTYRGESITWTKTSPYHSVTIQPYKNESPVFIGEGHPLWFKLGSTKGECTNITIRGMTIKNYVRYGILLRGNPNKPAEWNGCNTIEDNVFSELGNLYDTTNCSDCIGYAAVDLMNSDNNIIRNNVFINNEDVPANAAYMHAVYLAHGSSNNEVHGNFMSVISGDPVRVRNESNNNYVHGNYSDRAGRYGFISGYIDPSEGEKPSSGNRIKNNTVTFPYHLFSSIKLICTSDPCASSKFINEGQKYFYGGSPQSEKVGAIASGDFNGDGDGELVVAFNYDNFVKVVKSSGGKDRYLSKVLYISPSFEVNAFAAGDYHGVGKDQLLTAFRLRSSGRTDIYKGNGTSSLLSGGRIYSSEAWDVQAMTSGDFDGNGKDESIVAFDSKGSGETRIYRGNGASSVVNLGRIYSGSYVWNVSALTSGDFDQDGLYELVSALDNGTQVRVYKGNGVSSATNHGYIYSSNSWEIPAIAAGYYSGSSSPELITALKSNGETRLYKGDGVSSLISTRLYSSQSWNVSGLASGQFNTNSSDEMVTAFTWPGRTQIWAGNGTSSVTKEGIFYRR